MTVSPRTKDTHKSTPAPKTTAPPKAKTVPHAHIAAGSRRATDSEPGANCTDGARQEATPPDPRPNTPPLPTIQEPGSLTSHTQLSPSVNQLPALNIQASPPPKQPLKRDDPTSSHGQPAGHSQDEGKTPTTAVVSKPALISSPARLHFYNNERIRSLLAAARRKIPSRTDLLIMVDMRDGEFDAHKWERHQYTIAVATPANARTSTWLVMMCDHRNRLARVMFNANGPAGISRSNQEERDLYVKFALERAFDVFRGRVTVEGVNYTCLEDDTGGSFYATSLAIACVRRLPGLPLHDFMLDERKALIEHSALGANLREPPMSTTLGAESQVIGRISRHDGRFQWM